MINVTLSLFGIIILCFTSIFWLGSKEQYQDLLDHSYWSFFADRLFFNLIVGIILLITIGVINSLIQKITKYRISLRKVLMIDFLIFTICSVIFISWQSYHAHTTT